MTTLWVAGREYTYGGMPLDRGQVFEPKGLKNDEGLLRNHLAKPLEEWDVREHELVQCGECGARFVRANLLTVHGNNRHSE